jgi:superfamily II DNA/RNA helicase
MRFADIGLSDELLKAVTEAGYDEPTPIQAAAIPQVQMMRDLIAIAQTGTGKTASFVLPMIDVLANGRARARMPRSLILEPTRELAAQVAENFEKYGKYHKLSMALLIGGVQMGDQVKALKEGVDVLIATPGRLMDLFERGKILLTGCDLLVIDEADRMLDMGFIPISNDLFQTSGPAPDPAVQRDHAAADQEAGGQVPVEPEIYRGSAPGHGKHQYRAISCQGARSMRRSAKCCATLLRSDKASTAMIFCNRKTTVRELPRAAAARFFCAGEIHGDMDQSTRHCRARPVQGRRRSTFWSRPTLRRAGWTSRA